MSTATRRRDDEVIALQCAGAAAQNVRVQRRWIFIIFSELWRSIDRLGKSPKSNKEKRSYEQTYHDRSRSSLCHQPCRAQHRESADVQG